jgi:hypothetical protein
MRDGLRNIAAGRTASIEETLFPVLCNAGLLNAIDGVAAQEGRMLFMTTNHIERLSAALIRPGRVDVRLEFTHATDEQIMDFFVGFYQVGIWNVAGCRVLCCDAAASRYCCSGCLGK